MRALGIDIETFSSVSLIDCGVYKYVDTDNFKILLFAYAFDNEPIQMLDMESGDTLPEEVIEALHDINIIKFAFNAPFERTCISKHLGEYLDPKGWQCTMVKSLTLGLPGSLAKVYKALNFEEDKQKMFVGKSLIRYFSIPCKPSKVNGGRIRNLPEHDTEKWELFKTYCIQDVEVERAIRIKLERFETMEEEQELWELDQRINDRGVYTDKELINQAIACNARNSERLGEEFKELTGLNNAKSLKQIKAWIKEKTGMEVKSITKDTIPELIETISNRDVIQALGIRQEVGKTSVSKYQKMREVARSDNRVRGVLQFYGASRTGRWAGRLVQVHNLPQNKIADLDLARNLLRDGNFELLDMVYEKVPFVLSQLVRTAFVPTPGNRFIVADFSSIEARIIAYLAGEKWRMDVFNTHGKIYEASASQMFKVPLESITKGSVLRQKGKVSELALGYQGGVGALIKMGALDMGVKEEELPELVSSWRASNGSIVKFWKDVERAAIKTVKQKVVTTIQHGISFIPGPGILFIQLPSGRRLAYIKPQIDIDENYGSDKLTYEGMNQTINSWVRLETYGGKLAENIVQAVARDCLAVSMLRLDEEGYNIVMHVHDEVILDMPMGKGTLEDAAYIMGQPIAWAPGLPLRADGYECNYYKKD